MRIAVFGSGGRRSLEPLRLALEHFHKSYGVEALLVVIVNRTAKEAIRWAEGHGIPVHRFPPDHANLRDRSLEVATRQLVVAGKPTLGLGYAPTPSATACLQQIASCGIKVITGEPSGRTVEWS